MNGLTADQERLFEEAFHSVLRTDFPNYKGDLSRFMYAGKRAVSGGEMREFLRQAILFLTGSNLPWLRYELHREYWLNTSIENADNDEEPLEPENPDFKEMAELLTHRIIMSYTNGEKRRRFEQDADAFPYWQLRTIDDNRAYPECLEESKLVRHYQDPYWIKKKLPCARLFCRCSIIRKGSLT